MDENCFITPPINLNCWKHHAGFIKKQIESVKEIKDLDPLKFCLLKIGESQMDLYFGEYSPINISEQILGYIHSKKIFSSSQYQNWLYKDGKDYQLVELKDKSIWTLRLGEDVERYVHIHSGRYSPNTLRVKATTLKTAIFLLCLKQLGEIKSFETETVNKTRKKYLDESPLKSFSKIVVAGGRGLGTKENFRLIEDLAAALGGMAGASRPIFDDGWAKPAQQVGLTGKITKPGPYIAAGISGASQHMVGCSAAKRLVAINTDSSAAIFRYAHYGVVGNCLEILPALADAARKSK